MKKLPQAEPIPIAPAQLGQRKGKVHWEVNRFRESQNLAIKVGFRPLHKNYRRESLLKSGKISSTLHHCKTSEGIHFP
jgi:hypothetical protein